MVRIARLLLPLLLIVSLWGSEAGRLITEADSLLKKNDKASTTKAYNSYKSAYLNALLDGDTKTARKAKHGIVKSAALLGIDASSYEDDPEDDGSGSGRSDIKKPYKRGDLPRIVDYRANKNQVYLILSKKIDPKEVNIFTLKNNKTNKVIFDIPAVFNKELSHIKSRYFKDVRIAQNTPDTVRVVMEKGIDFEAEVATLSDKLVLTAYTTKGKKPSAKSNILPKTASAKHPVVKNRPKKSNKNKTIFIDAGHGGKDGGAVGYKKYREKDIVIAITKETVRELKRRGYTVRTTRSRDVFIPLRDRTKLANKHNADLFISVHANSVPRRIDIKGIETYFLSPARSERAKKVAAKENSADLKEMSHLSQETFLSFLNREKVTASNKFAIDIQKNILANLKKNYRSVVDNGVREGPFWVLVGAQMPAVLVEVGYITNPTEAKRMKTRRYQKLIAKGIADGVDSFFYYN